MKYIKCFFSRKNWVLMCFIAILMLVLLAIVLRVNDEKAVFIYKEIKKSEYVNIVDVECGYSYQHDGNYYLTDTGDVYISYDHKFFCTSITGEFKKITSTMFYTISLDKDNTMSIYEQKVVGMEHKMDIDGVLNVAASDNFFAYVTEDGDVMVSNYESVSSYVSVSDGEITFKKINGDLSVRDLAIVRNKIYMLCDNNVYVCTFSEKEKLCAVNVLNNMDIANIYGNMSMLYIETNNGKMYGYKEGEKVEKIKSMSSPKYFNAVQSHSIAVNNNNDVIIDGVLSAYKVYTYSGKTVGKTNGLVAISPKGWVEVDSDKILCYELR